MALGVLSELIKPGGLPAEGALAAVLRCGWLVGFVYVSVRDLLVTIKAGDDDGSSSASSRIRWIVDESGRGETTCIVGDCSRCFGVLV